MNERLRLFKITVIPPHNDREVHFIISKNEHEAVESMLFDATKDQEDIEHIRQFITNVEEGNHFSVEDPEFTNQRLGRSTGRVK